MLESPASAVQTREVRKGGWGWGKEAREGGGAWGEEVA